mmetsp:Transcript_23134/g.54697  ORF Transcript_23134/g.54697 Transcript_23134/m.54697 type:complete len:324 (+) Transcript_23134:130-1101(+)
MSQSFTQSSSSLPKNALDVFAQRLNNSAALCIEVGEYDRAILSLQRALELSRKHTSGTNGEMERECHRKGPQQCISLDSCISFSEVNCLYSNPTTTSCSKRKLGTSTCSITDVVHSMVDANSANDGSDVFRRGNKRRRIKVTSSERRFTASYNDYYVFTRPIRVPRRDQQVGSVLFLAILFNLALAHHLKATRMRTSARANSSESTTRAKSVQKALKLYQLILDYWSKLQNREGQSSNDFNSIRFRMILHNNLGQIYNWTGNPIKKEQCLQDLLSNVMIVTDQIHQHSGADSSCNGVGFKRDLEGFLTNTEALTAIERCAQAA